MMFGVGKCSQKIVWANSHPVDLWGNRTEANPKNNISTIPNSNEEFNVLPPGRRYWVKG